MWGDHNGRGLTQLVTSHISGHREMHAYTAERNARLSACMLLEDLLTHNFLHSSTVQEPAQKMVPFTLRVDLPTTLVQRRPASIDMPPGQSLTDSQARLTKVIITAAWRLPPGSLSRTLTWLPVAPWGLEGACPHKQPGTADELKTPGRTLSQQELDVDEYISQTSARR